MISINDFNYHYWLEEKDNEKENYWTRKEKSEKEKAEKEKEEE